VVPGLLNGHHQIVRQLTTGKTNDREEKPQEEDREDNSEAKKTKEAGAREKDTRCQATCQANGRRVSHFEDYGELIE
jgi:hypothetical protein